ncbi:hypothetical protein [Pseudomonas leptonychotis]|uniref:hypothetical protein n=1 Tax=Pseudomonas leptonychotis TaxID=2448482 RepID=UPI00386A67E1
MAGGDAWVFSPINLETNSGLATVVDRDFDSWWDWRSELLGGSPDGYVFSDGKLDAAPGLASFFTGVIEASFFGGSAGEIVIGEITPVDAVSVSATAYAEGQGGGATAAQTLVFTSNYTPDLPVAPGVTWRPTAEPINTPDSSAFLALQLPGASIDVSGMRVSASGPPAPAPIGFWTSFRAAVEII